MLSEYKVNVGKFDQNLGAVLLLHHNPKVLYWMEIW